MDKPVLLIAATAAACAAFAEIKTVSPAPGETVPLLTDAQKAYVRMDLATRREKFADASFRRNEMGKPAETIPGAEAPREAYWPKTVRLAWEGETNVSYRVEVKDVRTGKTLVDATVTGCELYIDNLEIAADYAWTVRAGEEAGQGAFKTEDLPPRLVRFPGVPNVRDFGGWIGLDGKRVRQGMVFRSAGLNDNAYDVYYTINELKEMGQLDAIKAAAEKAQARLDELLAWQKDPKMMNREDAEYKAWCLRHPDEPLARFLSSRVHAAKKAVQRGGEPKIPKEKAPGKSRVAGAKGEYIRARFGIKSDVDLRSHGECEGMTGSPLGDSVAWFNYSSSAYDGMQKNSGRSAFTKVFKVFLDEKNYPIDFHCIAGQDRTGAVAYILGALLGADENRLALDWEVTGFWNRSAAFSHAAKYDKLVDGFKRNYPADDVRERVEKYVLSLGFTADDIARFRSIMLED